MVPCVATISQNVAILIYRARKDASAKRQDLAPPKHLVRNVGKGKEPRASHRMVAEEANKAGLSNTDISYVLGMCIYQNNVKFLGKFLKLLQLIYCSSAPLAPLLGPQLL